MRGQAAAAGLNELVDLVEVAIFVVASLQPLNLRDGLHDRQRLLIKACIGQGIVRIS